MKQIIRFFERKLFATLLVLAVITAAFIVGTITEVPFISSYIITIVLYLFAQNQFDISQLKLDFEGIKIGNDQKSTLPPDPGFLSRKFLTCLVSILLLAYLGIVLKLIKSEWLFVGAVEVIFLIEVYAQGVLDMSRISLKTQTFSLQPDVSAPVAETTDSAEKAPVEDLPVSDTTPPAGGQ
jgi:hypothetical protein